MIGSIGPLGETDINRVRFSAFLFLSGSIIGSVTTGFVLGLCGWLVRWTFSIGTDVDNAQTQTIIAYLAILSGLIDAKLIPLKAPQIMCQVPREWLRVYGPYVTSLRWSLCISAGVMTVYTYSVYYVLAMWVVLNGSPLWGAVVFGAFGVVYGSVTAMALLLYRLRRFREWFDSFLPGSNGMGLMVGAAQLAAGAALLAVRR